MLFRSPPSTPPASKTVGLVQAAAVVTAPASLGGAILGRFEGKAGWVCLRSVSNRQLVHLKKPLRLSVQVAG